MKDVNLIDEQKRQRVQDLLMIFPPSSETVPFLLLEEKRDAKVSRDPSF